MRCTMGVLTEDRVGEDLGHVEFPNPLKSTEPVYTFGVCVPRKVRTCVVLRMPSVLVYPESSLVRGGSVVAALGVLEPASRYLAQVNLLRG